VNPKELHKITSSMTTLALSDKLALIKENLGEVLDPEIIESVLTEGRDLKGLGFSPLRL